MRAHTWDLAQPPALVFVSHSPPQHSLEVSRDQAPVEEGEAPHRLGVLLAVRLSVPVAWRIPEAS